jgi:hypothetical protein
MKELVDLPGHWVHVTCVAALYELRPLGMEIGKNRREGRL